MQHHQNNMLFDPHLKQLNPQQRPAGHFKRFLYLFSRQLANFLLALRRRDPEWYAPSYRVPGYPVLPAVGALASFGLIVFMQPASIALGAGLLVAAYGWYRYYAGDVRLRGDV